MHIRFFNTYEPVNSFYRDLLPYLSNLGHRVDVFVSGTEYRMARPPLHTTLSKPGIKIHYLSARRSFVLSRWQKFAVMLEYTIKAALRSLLEPNVDINFFLTQPPLFSFWGYVLKLVRGQRYCCLVMDLYPDVAVRDGLLKGNNIFTEILTKLARFALKRADMVFVIGRCMQKKLEHDGISPDNISFIPNWSNEHEIHPVPHIENRMRQELGLEGRFVVLYSGNMGASHYFDDVIEVARRLRHETKLRFVFIGGGTRRKEIESGIRRYNLDNFLLLPFQPLERLSEGLSMGDIHFISLRVGFEGLVVPSKAYGSLAVGRPILYQGSPDGEISQMVTENQIGMTVLPHDIDGLERAILYYYQNEEAVKIQGQKALRLSKEKFGRSQALNQYLIHLESLFPNRTYAKTIYE